VVARHHLITTDRAVAGGAELAGAAGHHCRHDHRPPNPLLGGATGAHHTTADLVTEGERQCVIGAHAVIEVTEIGVAYAATGDLDHDLTGVEITDLELGTDHRLARG